MHPDFSLICRITEMNIINLKKEIFIYLSNQHLSSKKILFLKLLIDVKSDWSTFFLVSSKTNNNKYGSFLTDQFIPTSTRIRAIVV